LFHVALQGRLIHWDKHSKKTPMNTIARYTQPPVNPLNRIQLARPEKYALHNGIPVYQINSGTQDLVMIEMIFNAGSWYQPKPFTSLGTSLMLREGTKDHTSQEISEKLDFYGAHLETTTEKDLALVTLYTLNKHLDNTLPVLEDILKNAVFPDEECGIMLRKQKQALDIDMQKVRYLARTRFNALLYGESHPYGAYRRQEDIEGASTELFRNFYHSHYQAANCRIIVAGKIPDSLPGQLQRLFGGTDWLRPEINEPVFVPGPSGEKESFVVKDDALQSAIRMGRVMFNRNHPDFVGMHFLNTLLGGYFGSRLMGNLREDKGYTYGIGSAIIPLQHSGFFFISAETGSEVTIKAVREIEKELEKLCNDLVSEDELSLVRNYLQGSFLRSIDGPFAMAERYRDLMQAGFDVEYFDEMLETQRTITAQQLRELARKYLKPDEMYRLIAGKQA